jgi:hypothetical protein
MAILLIPGLMTLNKALPYIILALPIGLILPDYILVKLIRKRQSAVRRGLPDVLDMLVVCSEAGMGLNAAIQRVALEMDIQHPILADELKTTMLHMGAGMDGRTALQELANRTGLDEMRSLAATLQQAMRFGTSISETLRAYSEEMRNKRLEAAQEQAAQGRRQDAHPHRPLHAPGRHGDRYGHPHDQAHGRPHRQVRTAPGYGLRSPGAGGPRAPGRLCPDPDPDRLGRPPPPPRPWPRAMRPWRRATRPRPLRIPPRPASG